MRVRLFWPPFALLAMFACTGSDPTIDRNPPAALDGGPGVVTPEAGPAPPVTCTAPETACGTTCADLATNDAHCGRCDHSCKGDGCQSGRCRPADLMDGLTDPTAVATHDGTMQVVARSGIAIVKCAKTGCGKVGAPIWTDFTWQASKKSAIALTYDGIAALLFDPDTDEQRYVFDKVQAVSASPPIYVPPSPFVHLAADPTPERANDVVGQYDYGVFACPAGICASGIAIEYAGEQGEKTVAIQPGNPGYYLWNTYANIHYCARGSSTETNPCTPQKLLQADFPGQIDFLTVTSTRAYWAARVLDEYRVYSCPFPAGCAAPTLLVEDEPHMTRFAADDAGIYWTDDESGFLRACLDPTAGCGPNAITLLSNLAQPWAIALDKETVYVTQRAGEMPSRGKVTRLHR